MDVLRRNTDYGMRVMVTLARNFGNGLMSSRRLATDGNFSYELGCKILQKLHKAGLVKSALGQKGGFALIKSPSEITFMEVINVLQDGICLNKCLSIDDSCEYQADCAISEKLAHLQSYIHNYLGAITLSDIVEARNGKDKN